MTGPITTTQLDDGIATIVAANALGALRANTVLARLVNRDWENEVASYGQTVNIISRGALTAQDKAEGSAVTLQQPTDSKVQLTLNKHKEVSILMEDLVRMLNRPDQFAGFIADAVTVIAEQIDADIAGLYSGLSQSVNALAGLSESHFRSARRLLNAAKAPMSQRYAVLNEDADYEFLGIEKVVNSEYAQSLGNAAAGAFMGRFMGFDVFMDQKIVTASSEGKNLAFHRNAFVAAFRPMALAAPGLGVQQVTMDEDGIGLRVTRSYSPTYLGEQVTIDILYGVAELRDSHGVVIRTTDI